MTNRRLRLTPDLAVKLTIDGEPYLSCDDCFHFVDQYVESLLGGKEEMPAMRAHLRGCSACRDEATSLLLLVAADEGTDPAAALQRLAQ
jgi:hypothetical protein